MFFTGTQVNLFFCSIYTKIVKLSIKVNDCKEKQPLKRIAYGHFANILTIISLSVRSKMKKLGGGFY